MAAHMATGHAVTGAPVLPASRTVSLPAGDVRLRDVPGPVGAPTVILLHGWTATADINFYRCYEPLAEHFRVLAFDHRGHGTGIRSSRPFRLPDCADDVIALADVEEIDSFVAVGYSMGGAIAQLLAKSSPERVRGVVLCSTAARFTGQPINRLSFAGLAGFAALARVTPGPARRRVMERWFTQRRVGDWQPWAIEAALANDWRMILEAGAALGAFNSTSWLPTVNVPASVVMTTRDDVVPLPRQRELAALLDADEYTLDAGHEAAVAVAEEFSALVIRAVNSVIERDSTAR
jgi:3-oxoadipate enol-lactonase